MEEITDLIEEGKDHYGSQTFDQHLGELVRVGAVQFDVAKAAANNPADFDLKMNMLGDSKSARGATGSRPGGTQDLADEMSRLMKG
jgi:twitching motility protein PilT